MVIESARPRALEQMGIVAAEELRRPAGPQVWVSITSHGRGPGQAERVAFGDVAAVAGGLVARDDQGPASSPMRSPTPCAAWSPPPPCWRRSPPAVAGC